MAISGTEPTHTRTIAMVGHRSAGKTSLGDMLLKAAGVTRTVGRVDTQTSLLDHEPEERRRRATLGHAWAWFEWQHLLVHLVDTPGMAELAHERSIALSCTDAAIVVVSASDGVEIGTERSLADAEQLGIARMVVVTKMEQEHDLEALLDDIDAATGARVVPIQLPFFEEVDEGLHRGEAFQGVVSLLDERVYRYDEGGSGAFSPEPVPERLNSRARVAWDRLVEAVALTDDTLLEAYLEYLELPRSQVLEGLRRAVVAGEILPVVFASARKVIGAEPILDAMARLLPSPVERALPTRTDLDGVEVPLDVEGPFVAQLIARRFDEDNEIYSVFRVWAGALSRHGRWVNANTGAAFKVKRLYQLRGPRRKQAFHVQPGAIFATWDPVPGRPGDTFTEGLRSTLPVPPIAPSMMSYLVSCEGDQKRFRAHLETLVSMDRGLQLYTDEITGGMLLAGLAEGHVQRAMALLQRRFGLLLRFQLPPVAYREIPLAAVRGVEGVHQRISDGLVSEFGACRLDVAPNAPDVGNRYVDAALEDAIPTRFRPAIDEGVQRGMLHGPKAGYPVLGAEVRLTGGDYNILFSEDEHFRAAAELALRNALAQVGTRLLEPWCRVRVWIREEDVGSVTQDVANNRGRITGIELDGPVMMITAMCPYRELRTFAPRLQAITHGRGRFEYHMTHYETLPHHLENEAIASSPFKSAEYQTDWNSGQALAG